MIAPAGGSRADGPLLRPVPDRHSCPDCHGDLVRTWDAGHVVTDWCPRCSYAEAVVNVRGKEHPVVQGGQGRSAGDIIASAAIAVGALALLGLGILIGRLL